MAPRELKYRAMIRIQTVRPNPCLVAFAVIAFGWIVTGLSQRIGGQPFYLDLDAAANMDAEHMFVVDWSNVTPISSILLIALEFLSVILSIGFLRYTLNVCRESPSGFGDLLSGFDYPFKAVVLWFLTRLICSALLLLLIVPGWIASIAYSMAPRLLCDHPDWSPIRCMKESRQLMRGHKMELFWLELSFLGWIILSMIPGISVFVQPYMELTFSEYYLQLVAPSDDDRTENSTEDKPPWEY